MICQTCTKPIPELKSIYELGTQKTTLIGELLHYVYKATCCGAITIYREQWMTKQI